MQGMQKGIMMRTEKLLLPGMPLEPVACSICSCCLSCTYGAALLVSRFGLLLGGQSGSIWQCGTFGGSGSAGSSHLAIFTSPAKNGSLAVSLDDP